MINGARLPGEDRGDEESAWVRGLFDALAPHQSGVYVNFLMDESPERVRQAYGEAKHRRLVALRDRLDPQNTFRMNQNIIPSRAAE